MKVSSYLKESFCIMNLESQDKEGAIKELAQKLNLSGNILDEDRFIKDVLERETLGSTGIGHNVGIPHARTTAVRGLVIGFGRSLSGIDFNALDGKKVNLIFLMGANNKELNLYLRVLAELSKLLMDSAFRQALMVASNPNDVIKVVKQFEKG